MRFTSKLVVTIAFAALAACGGNNANNTAEMNADLNAGMTDLNATTDLNAAGNTDLNGASGGNTYENTTTNNVT